MDKESAYFPARCVWLEVSKELKLQPLRPQPQLEERRDKIKRIL